MLQKSSRLKYPQQKTED